MPDTFARHRAGIFIFESAAELANPQEQFCERPLMDVQTFINLGAGTVLAVVGWIARELWGAVKELRSDLTKLREELPKGYVSRDDFKEGMKEIKELLVNIDAKLDRKADK